MKRTLRLLGNLVALQPLRRKQSDSGILYDMSRMDDRMQWLVINVSRKVWERGEIKVGDHVIVDVTMDVKHEFSDNITIIDACYIRAVVKEESETHAHGLASMGIEPVQGQNENSEVHGASSALRA